MLQKPKLRGMVGNCKEASFQCEEAVSTHYCGFQTQHILLKLMSIQTKPVAAWSVTKGIPSLSTHSYQVSFEISLRCNKFVIIIKFVIFHSGEIFTCWILEMAFRWVQLPCNAGIWFKHLLFKHCLLLICNQ